MSVGSILLAGHRAIESRGGDHARQLPLPCPSAGLGRRLGVYHAELVRGEVSRRWDYDHAGDQSVLGWLVGEGAVVEMHGGRSDRTNKVGGVSERVFRRTKAVTLRWGDESRNARRECEEQEDGERRHGEQQTDEADEMVVLFRQ